MKSILLLFALSFLVLPGYGSKPHLSFFCELNSKEFNELFADTALINELVEMKAAVRIGLHDFSDERTKTIQRLNKAGIPVVAWLLLPEEDGYWFNMRNGDKAVKRYDEFRKWTAEYNLKWEGIGIDIEPDMNDAKLALSHPWKFACKVYKRLYDNASLKTGKEIYQKLISKMKTDGYIVESYIIPFLFEDRDKKITTVEKLMGIVDISVDKEIPMTYTSAMGNPAIIPLNHRGNMPIALGSTGGGVKIEGIELASLSWENLRRDLLIASKLTNEIHIFCLETSASKGYLEKIGKLDFEQIETVHAAEMEQQKKINGIIRFFLVILNHPFWMTVCVLVIFSGILYGIYKLFVFFFRVLAPNKIKSKQD